MMYSVEDFKHGTPPRVIGSESELNAIGINESVLSSRSYGTLSDYVPPEVFLAQDDGEALSGVFLRNGGRVYWEKAGLIESATPECLTPSELLRHERLGEIAAATIIENLAQKYSVSDGLYKRTGYTWLSLSSGNVVQTPDSAGNHEGYFSPNSHLSSDQCQEYEETIRPPVNSYLATRIVWSGAGMITNSGYVVSQKAHTVDLDLTPSYTQPIEDFNNKPAFNIRRGDRLEIRTGEGNMSDWALQQKFAVTSLMLRLVEHHRFPDTLLLANPTQAMRDLSVNPNGYVELDNGLQITGIQHQREIAMLMKDFCDDFPETPAEEKAAVSELNRVLNDLDRSSLIDGDVAAIRDRVDWAAKFSYLKEKGANLRGLTSHDAHTVMRDLKWEGIGKHNIANRWYRKFGQNVLQPSTGQLHAMKPPKGRAAERVAIVERLNQASTTVKSIDWGVISTSSSRIFLDDPYGLS